MDSRTNSKALLCPLKQCEKRKSFMRQAKLLEASSLKTIQLANAIISTYSKFGNMQDALRVFLSMPQRNVISWTALIHGYVENGSSVTALDVFHSMDCLPNHVTFLVAIKACYTAKLDKETCLWKGVCIHARAKSFGFDQDIFVANTLIQMYSKCGSVIHALRVFAEMKNRDVVSWNNLIMGHADNGQSSIAVDMFMSMDCAPNVITFVVVLKACATAATTSQLRREAWLEKAMIIHRQATELGFDMNVVVANTLVDMYCKYRDMQRARKVFDSMVNRTIVSWNVLLLGHVENDQSYEALHLFERINCEPSPVTFIAAFKACGALSSLKRGMHVHNLAKQAGLDKNQAVANTLIDMYSKCRNMLHAREVFNGMTKQDDVSWNALLLGYVDNGESSIALDMFNEMDCAPSALTYVAALKACAFIGDEASGQRIHNRICQLGLEQDVMVGTCLVDFYGKCGKIDAAEAVFSRMCSHSRETWTTLIGGYSLLGDTTQVFTLVNRMQETGLELDSVTLQLILVACSHAGMVEEGYWYFKTMQRYGINPTLEHYTCMVNMLARAQRLDEALSVVNRMPFASDGVVWTSLLEGCRKWCNLEIGKVAFDALIDINVNVTVACLLMKSMKMGMEEERER